MLIDRIQHIFAELKRRRVFRAAGAYLVMGWVAIEVAGTVAPMMGFPDWVPRVVLFVVLTGFPVAVGVAWAFDLTEEGVRRTGARGGPGAGEGSSRPETGPGVAPVMAMAAAAVVVAAGVWYLASRDPGARVVDRSIAVLPFETLGEDRRNAFTEGIHAGLLTRLAGVSELEVISRTSVQRYGAQEKSLREIASELGVAWVVRGEVQESGDQVLVNVRLADARNDRQVWAEAYRRELTAENVFQIQGDITRTIVAALEGHLTAGERERVERAPTENLQAYRLYLQGRRYLDRRDEEMTRAADYFSRAIAADSSFALAWVGLSDALTLLTSYGYREAGDVLPEAERAAARALELDPGLAEAHASLGMLNEARRRGERAVALLERAVELRPSYGEAHNWLAWLHLLLGHDDLALESARRAVEIDPLHLEALGNLVNGYLAAGDPAQAIVEARRAREVYPEARDLDLLMGVSLYHAGRYAEARPYLEAPVSWAGTGPGLTLALADLAMGDTTRARSAATRFEGADEWFAVGVIRAALGDRDAAFDALDRVSEWGAYWPALAVHHYYPDVWSTLEEDPRYATILDRVSQAWRRGS